MFQFVYLYLIMPVNIFTSLSEFLDAQQNGVAQRKLQHVSEVTRTLLFHMGVPKSY
jgi:hypothetical protein